MRPCLLFVFLFFSCMFRVQAGNKNVVRTDTVDFYQLFLNGKQLFPKKVNDPKTKLLIDKGYVLNQLDDKDELRVMYFSDACHNDCGQLELGNNQGVTLSTLNKEKGQNYFRLTGAFINKLFFENDNAVNMYFVTPRTQAKFAGVWLGCLVGMAPKSIVQPICTPKSPYKIKDLRIVDKQNLVWGVITDSLTSTCIVQQFRWNKWVNWDTLTCIKKKDSIEFRYPIARYIHDGHNRFRIKGYVKDGLAYYSDNASQDEPEETKLLHIESPLYYKTHPITFNRETFFEFYDSNGTLVKKGHEKMLLVNTYGKGLYYLCYENSIVEVILE
jgi:hypothetical protein